MALRLMAIGLFVAIVATASGSNVAKVRHCPRSIPSTDLISLGVDITRIDLVPINTDRISERGFKAPIIDLSCSEENRRAFFGKENIDVFDQWSLFTEDTSGMAAKHVSYISNSQEIMDNLAINAKVEGRYGFVSGSLSGSYKKMKTDISETTKYIGQTKYTYLVYKGILSSDVRLSLEASNDLERIDLGEKKVQPYLDFIKQYGTHYFHSAKFGGEFKDTFVISTSLKNSYQDREISVALEVISGIVDVNTNVTKKEKAAIVDIKNDSDESRSYLGGSGSVNDLPAWEQNVQSSPNLLAGELKMIADLIPYQETRANMESAVAQYVQREIMNDMINDDSYNKVLAAKVQKLLHGKDEISDEIPAKEVQTLKKWWMNAKNTWKVVTKTSSVHNAEADSTIYMEIKGKMRNSPRLGYLNNPNYDDFESGATDTFEFPDVQNVGDVESIVFYMRVGPGDDDAWLVESVELTNERTGVTYVFQNSPDGWLDGNDGDDKEDFASIELAVS